MSDTPVPVAPSTISPELITPAVGDEVAESLLSEAVAQTPPAVAWDGKVESLDPGVQKMITGLRKEAGDNRVAKNAETDRVNAILKAAGIATDDPDPVEVAKTASAAATSAIRELAVFKAAASSGVDPSKLLDRASFLTSIAGLDPSDGAAITAAINTAILADPTLKAVLAASASGTELGGTGETGQITEAQLAQMTPEQIVDAQEKGLLKNLLG